MKTIIIDGIEYVEKSKDNPEVVENYVLVRTYSAGVWVGYLKKENGDEVELENARNIWYWSGAASLSQLAMEGVKDPDNCKFPMEVPKIILKGVISIIPCTEEAKQNISEVPVWKK